MRRAGVNLRALMPAIVVFMLLLTSSCGPISRLRAVPAAQQERATVLGIEGVRHWGDSTSPEFSQEAFDAFRREQSLAIAAGRSGNLPPANFLAISGGGENGAYGAGILVGWTKAGTRPQFKLVTGVSTGALTAPFAFLGSAYDTQLQEVYTTLSAKDVLRERGMLSALIQDAMADNAPLRKTIQRYVTQEVLDAIAVEYRKGRLLMVGTTNLDARRPVVWNMTKLAASGHPKALDTFHDILLASAAIPGVFPPAMIDVDIDGKHYQEMHVDGGTSSQVFVYPPSLDIKGESRRLNIVRDRNLYVIRNAPLRPDWVEVDRSTLTIAGRAVTSLIQTQGVGDLYRIYLAAERDGINFNVTYIPDSFTTPLKEPFETAYMIELFKLGYELSVKGTQWAYVPPGFSAPEIEPPVNTGVGKK